MPRPTATARAPQYEALRAESRTQGETNDCTVVAIAAACGVSYAVAHAAMAKVGRTSGKGARYGTIFDAVESLGFRVVRVAFDEMTSRYPGAFANVPNLTSHHPDRFPKAWRDGNTYLMHTKGHVLAIVNGVNCDWTRGTAKRAVNLFRVEKI